jgi:anti-sigma factor RsiW
MAISCQQAAEWIEQALDGTITPRHERLLNRHMQKCPRCRERYELEKRAVEALRAVPAAAVPADLPHRVLASLPDLSPRLLGRIADVLRRAAVDVDIRRRLRENPTATLLSMHIALPPGMRIEVVSEQPAPLPTADTLYLPLPEVPLAIEELDQRLAAMGLGPLFGFWW